MVLTRSLRASAGSGLLETGTPDATWLQRFHRGDRATLEDCYREHFTAVERAVAPVLSGLDREAAIHEVFARLIARAEVRRSFQGGSLAAWLATMARNHAIDVRRRSAREATVLSEAEAQMDGGPADWANAAHARLLIDQFEREQLPPGWLGVFRLRFLQQLPQREAAACLSIRRTTLAYRELRIRRLLKRFLLTDRSQSGKRGAP
jgi:RNA polymerase sigma-70 factor (ECF subfamily)